MASSSPSSGRGATETGDASGQENPDQDNPAIPPAEPAPEPSFLSGLRDRFLGVDRRTLGVFRLYFGSVLLIDTLRRLPEGTFLYSNDGVLSNHFALFSPQAKPIFSFLFAFSTPGEARLGLLIFAAIHLFYLLGYRTRVFQILAFVAYTSLNARNLFVESEGSTLICLLLAWTMFLPLGDRFSLDALGRSLSSRRDLKVASLDDRASLLPDTSLHLSLAVLGVLLQIACLHGAHLLHQTGEGWRSGEAMHWALWQNRIASSFAGWFRLHEPSWFSVLLTRLVQLLEGGSVLLVLIPFATRYTRLALFACGALLSLGIAALFNLGPLPYALFALHLLALPPESLDRVAAWLRQGKVPRTVVYDPADAGMHFVARLLARLDLFGYLRFIDGSDTARLPSGAPKATIATLHGGTWTRGTAAIASASASLPLGALLGPLLQGGAGQRLLRGVLLRRQRWVEAYGLEPAVKASEKGPLFELSDDPTPLELQTALTLSAMRESCVFVLLLASGFAAARDHGPARREIPLALRPIIEYPRLFQNWNLLTPDIPRQDGTLVIDGTTADGRHLDPLTGEAPDFEAPLRGPWSRGQLRNGYALKIFAESNRPYRDEFRRYLLNWQTLTGRPPQDRVVSFEAYWVSSDSPAPGQSVPSKPVKVLLFTNR
jgi:hypothetical protein